MKARIKEVESKKFKPFTLEIDIETKDDLFEMFHRFNVTTRQLLKISSNKYFTEQDHAYGTWFILREKCKEVAGE